MTAHAFPNDVSVWPPKLADAEFFQFVREERMFCAAVAHLLLQRGNNIRLFIELINERLPSERRINSAGSDDAEVFLEFTYLRDSWNRLERDNDSKRRAIIGLLAKVGSLSAITSDLPQEPARFNEYFMGERGFRIKNDIVYPGQWSVAALHERFRGDRTLFRDACKFKWSFNIKPDMVILAPYASPICVEAKLESREGLYPSNTSESLLFDNIFEPQQGRVTQFELQRFMFESLLQSPCQQVVLSRDTLATENEPLELIPFVTWHDVFERLDLTASISFVEKLVRMNRHVAAHPRMTAAGTLAPRGT
jgi:hypothetical protein